MLFWRHFSLGYTSNFKRNTENLSFGIDAFVMENFTTILIGCGDGRDFNSGAAWVGSNLANCQTKAKAYGLSPIKIERA